MERSVHHASAVQRLRECMCHTPGGGPSMSTHGMQRDPCCVFPADGKTDTKDLFELKAVADGVYAAIAAPQYKVNSNAAVILTNDGVVVVDSHSKPSAARVLDRKSTRLNSSHGSI